MLVETAFSFALLASALYIGTSIGKLSERARLADARRRLRDERRRLRATGGEAAVAAKLTESAEAPVDAVQEAEPAFGVFA